MKIKVLLLSAITVILFTNYAFTQEKLSLDTVIARVIRTHPGIEDAKQAMEVAAARIGLSESAYYPNIDASSSYSRIGPVAKFDFPGFGVIKIYPEDNYSVSVNFRQMIYDFGRTAKSIEVEKAGMLLAEKGLDISRQYLAMAATASFYTLYFINSALSIKDEQLRTLNEHLDFVQKMKQTGSATEFEILTTRVKISSIESQKTDLLAMQQTQTSILNSLLGQSYNSSIIPDVNLENLGIEPVTDSLLNQALSERNEMQMAVQQAEIAKLQKEFEKSKNNPSFNAFVTGGAKNGYVPELYKFQPNFVAGVSFTLPVFDGYRERNNLLIAQAKINSAQSKIESEKLTITNEVIQAESELMSAGKKIDQYSIQADQADQAMELAKVSFRAGSITNLDLLTAETSAAESHLMLLKSKVDYNLCLSKLKMVSGQKLY
jgi:outer membrane protein